MTNNEHEGSEDHDIELSEMQRRVVAAAIETTEAAIAARERDHDLCLTPALRVRAIASVVVHVMNEYAAEYHLDWTRKNWCEHQVQSAMAALNADNAQLVHDIVVEVSRDSE